MQFRIMLIGIWPAVPGETQAFVLRYVHPAVLEMLHYTFSIIKLNPGGNAAFPFPSEGY